MTYKYLLDSLTKLNLHPLAETNVYAVTADRGAALLHFDTSAEEEELTDLKAELESAESDFAETEDELHRQQLQTHGLLEWLKTFAQLTDSDIHCLSEVFKARDIARAAIAQVEGIQ